MGRVGMVRLDKLQILCSADPMLERPINNGNFGTVHKDLKARSHLSVDHDG